MPDTNKDEQLAEYQRELEAFRRLICNHDGICILRPGHQGPHSALAPPPDEQYLQRIADLETRVQQLMEERARYKDELSQVRTEVGVRALLADMKGAEYDPIACTIMTHTVEDAVQSLHQLNREEPRKDPSWRWCPTCDGPLFEDSPGDVCGTCHNPVIRTTITGLAARTSNAIESREKTIRQLRETIEASIRLAGPDVVICREGGGPESTEGTLALTIGRMVSQLEKFRSNKKEKP